MKIKVVPLGAGQDVGKSCIIVQIGSHTIMLDCGMHMGYEDRRRFPDFSSISSIGNFTETIDCVLISHFHLDHCGALPLFTEMHGYEGPIYMTYPTKAICPILLEDMRKVVVERRGDKYFFTSQMIKRCMDKVQCLDLNETVYLGNDLQITPFYAGHVLGAVMFFVRSNGESILYTGDFNMTPDRHLGAVKVPRNLEPDVLITESTYAGMVRSSIGEREDNFLEKVYRTVIRGGKVLIPVFAVGRCQELSILLEDYQNKNADKLQNVPIYISSVLTRFSNEYYRMFVNQTSEFVREQCRKGINMFDFKHIKQFDFDKHAQLDSPMVVLASPGMLHSGMSLKIFRLWATDKRNLVILPGFPSRFYIQLLKFYAFFFRYCVSGTVGNMLLGGSKSVSIKKHLKVDVKCEVSGLSFSAHADSNGIKDLIRNCKPSNVVLVHGESKKMVKFCKVIEKEFGISCYCPSNGQTLECKSNKQIPIDISVSLIEKCCSQFKKYEIESNNINKLKGKSAKKTDGVPITKALLLVDESNQKFELMEIDKALQKLGAGLVQHKIFICQQYCFNICNMDLEKNFKFFENNFSFLKIFNKIENFNFSSSQRLLINFKLYFDKKKCQKNNSKESEKEKEKDYRLVDLELHFYNFIEKTDHLFKNSDTEIYDDDILSTNINLYQNNDFKIDLNTIDKLKSKNVHFELKYRSIHLRISQKVLPEQNCKFLYKNNIDSDYYCQRLYQNIEDNKYAEIIEACLIDQIFENHI